MGNANTHERRKSGVPETGLTIENIREKSLNEEEADGNQAVSSVAEKKTEKTPPPSFDTTEEDKREDDSVQASEEKEDFRPRAGTAETGGRTKKPSTQCNPGSKGLPTIFKYAGDAKEAYVCGTFSNWDKIPMVRTQKDFVAMVELPVGDHQFKYYVDNEWTSDKNLPTVDNDCGSKNSTSASSTLPHSHFALVPSPRWSSRPSPRSWCSLGAFAPQRVCWQVCLQLQGRMPRGGTGHRCAAASRPVATCSRSYSTGTGIGQ